MEVHQHTHTPRKKWTHYFWEFLMLFLAVTLGFFVENQREHMVEHQREKQFIRSFVEDLKLDTGSITNNIVLRTNKTRTIDSLILYLNKPNPNQYSQMIYFWARQLTRSNRFISTDRTIKQLKNSGGLRLIKNQEASDNIMAYDEAVDRLYYAQSRQTEEILTVSPLMGKLLNANVLETMIFGEEIRKPAGNPPLRSVDKDFLLDFIYDVHQLKSSDVFIIAYLKTLKENFAKTIEFLKREYHLK